MVFGAYVYYSSLVFNLGKTLMNCYTGTNVQASDNRVVPGGMTLTDAELTQALTDLKYLSAPKIAHAQKDAARERISLYDVIVQKDYLNEDDLGKVLAYHYQLPYISIASSNIASSLLHLLPKAVAEKYQSVPFGVDADGLHIATTRPESKDLFAMLTKKAGAKSYRLSYTSQSSIRAALYLYKEKLQSVFNTLLEQAISGSVPIANLVDELFEYAYETRASDIHIEPLQDRTVIRFRIDGVLHDEATIPKKLHAQMVSRLKVMARLRTDEHLSAQDGRLNITVGGEDLTARVSIVPVVTGEKVVMRVLAKNSRQFSLADLGMHEADLKQVKKGFNKPFGMILSTGPTGSGKTTTMYSVLKILNTRARNIATIEDPVEYELEGINQIQVNSKSNLTFSEGLRSLLRQDPDILFVGEIRDQDTASIAVNAAMTGHLVLSTMHTNDAVTTLPRLIDMDVEPFLAASTVNIIIGQRLVRKICEHCKTSLELKKTAKGWIGDTEQVGLLGSLNPTLLDQHVGKKTSLRIYRGAGCTACHDTGYQGRLGIFEVLEITPKLAALITAKASSDTLAAQAEADGMSTMLDDGMEKVLTGQTTLSEIVRVTMG